MCPTIHATNYSFLSFLSCCSVISSISGRQQQQQLLPLFVVIDCGIPLDLKHGTYQLLNSSTTYQSIVKYHCHDNYSLIGNETRNCSQHATWTGTEPTCKREYILFFIIMDLFFPLFLSFHASSYPSCVSFGEPLSLSLLTCHNLPVATTHPKPLALIPIGICLSWEGEEVRFPL